MTNEEQLLNSLYEKAKSLSKENKISRALLYYNLIADFKDVSLQDGLIKENALKELLTLYPGQTDQEQFKKYEILYNDQVGINKIRVALESKNYEHALLACGDISQHSPRYTEVLDYYDEIFSALKKYKDAIGFLKEATKPPISKIPSWTDIGVRLQQEGNVEDALKYLGRQNNQEAMSLYEKGSFVYQTWGMTQEALSCFWAISENEDEYFAVCDAIAFCFYTEKKYDEAFRWFEKSFRLNPKNEIALENIGEILMIKKNYQSAYNWYHWVNSNGWRRWAVTGMRNAQDGLDANALTKEETFEATLKNVSMKRATQRAATFNSARMAQVKEDYDSTVDPNINPFKDHQL